MADRLARWISILFDSSILSLPIFLAFGYVSARTLGLLWATLTLLIVTGIPLAYLLIGIQRGWVSDMELSKREERPRCGRFSPCRWWPGRACIAANMTSPN